MAIGDSSSILKGMWRHNWKPVLELCPCLARLRHLTCHHAVHAMGNAMGSYACCSFYISSFSPSHACCPLDVGLQLLSCCCEVVSLEDHNGIALSTLAFLSRMAAKSIAGLSLTNAS
mmetsp:Transcript_33626/g.66143  ORF Transcript_33626/g.66143 Transcript_33626/m.66143 type:complete len:117 (-) Transcript_33626:2558-2908(-)